MVSQCMMELQRFKMVGGKGAPQSTFEGGLEREACYRAEKLLQVQWGTAQRCEGWNYWADDESGESNEFGF